MQFRGRWENNQQRLGPSPPPSCFLGCSSSLQCGNGLQSDLLCQHIYQMLQTVFNQFLGYQVLGYKSFLSTLWFWNMNSSHSWSFQVCCCQEELFTNLNSDPERWWLRRTDLLLAGYSFPQNILSTKFEVLKKIQGSTVWVFHLGLRNSVFYF